MLEHGDLGLLHHGEIEHPRRARAHGAEGGLGPRPVRVGAGVFLGVGGDGGPHGRGHRLALEGVGVVEVGVGAAQRLGEGDGGEEAAQQVDVDGLGVAPIRRGAPEPRLHGGEPAVYPHAFEPAAEAPELVW